TSFATDTNANDDRSKTNPVVSNGIGMFHMNPLKIMCFLLLPRWINRLLGVKRQFLDGPFHFFRDLTREIVRKRKEGVVKRNDLVQLMIDAYVYENELNETTYDKLTADMDKECKFGF